MDRAYISFIYFCGFLNRIFRIFSAEIKSFDFPLNTLNTKKNPLEFGGFSVKLKKNPIFVSESRAS